MSQFQEQTGESLARAIDTLFKQNQGTMKGMVLDLRNDPGGLLNGAVAVSAAFLPITRSSFTPMAVPRMRA